MKSALEFVLDLLQKSLDDLYRELEWQCCSVEQSDFIVAKAQIIKTLRKQIQEAIDLS